MKQKKFNTPKINLVIDAVMLIIMAVMTGIGFLMNYILVPGYKKNVIYGSNVDLYFWGYDRHQWGTIHYYAGLAFLILIILHIVLHWKMIKNIYRRLIPNRLAARAAAVLMAIIITAAVLIPLLLKPEVVENKTSGKNKHQMHNRIERIK